MPIIGIILTKICKKAVKRPIFQIEKKYAVMLNTLFVAFNYGMVMPLLFLLMGISFGC